MVASVNDVMLPNNPMPAVSPEAFLLLREADLKLREADIELANIRETHARELRVADQTAVRLVQAANDAQFALVQKYNDSHFLQLNENAKRTIEERSHFVSVDTYATSYHGLEAKIDVMKMTFDEAISDLKKSRDTSTGQQRATLLTMGAFFALITLALRFIPGS